MPGLPLAFLFRSSSPRSPACHFVFSSASRGGAPGARAVSAAAAHLKSSPEGRDRVAHALVATPFAPRHCGLPHFRDGGTGAESSARGNGAGGVLAHRVGRRLAGGAWLGEQNCRCRTQNRGGGKELATRRRRGNIGSAATSCSSTGQAQDRLRALKPVLFVLIGCRFFRDRKICHRASKTPIVWIADGLDRGHARDSPVSCVCFRRTHYCYGSNNRSRLRACKPNWASMRGAPCGPLRLPGCRLQACRPGTGVVRALDRKGLQPGEARSILARRR